MSTETHAVTDAVIAWGQKRWPGCRVLRELVLGERRIDLLFVSERDLAGVEIKGPKDKLDRLRDQVKEYQRYVPEVWVAAHMKWTGAPELAYIPNRIIVWSDFAITSNRGGFGSRAQRDELVCSRLLELLWRDEAVRIAARENVLPISTSAKSGEIKKLLARLLTGNEIIHNVCTELRGRPLVGLGSGAAVR